MDLTLANKGLGHLDFSLVKKDPLEKLMELIPVTSILRSIIMDQVETKV